MRGCGLDRSEKSKRLQIEMGEAREPWEFDDDKPDWVSLPIQRRGPAAVVLAAAAKMAGQVLGALGRNKPDKTLPAVSYHDGAMNDPTNQPWAFSDKPAAMAPAVVRYDDDAIAWAFWKWGGGIFGGLVALLTFVIGWGSAVGSWGWLLGLAFGWIPAIIIAVMAGLLAWALAPLLWLGLLCAVIWWALTWRR